MQAKAAAAAKRRQQKSTGKFKWGNELVINPMHEQLDRAFFMWLSAIFISDASRVSSRD
jgi:hypothetical protein